MKFCTVGCVVLLLVSGSMAAEVTPVQKVIQLMTGMLEKGKKEKHEEQVQFSAYKTFCDNTAGQKKRAIEKANDMIDYLKADIEKYAADASKLGKEIAKHDMDIATWDGDKKAITSVREIDQAEFLGIHTDYTTCIDELEKAIRETKAQQAAQGSSFIQLSALQNLTHLPAKAKWAIDDFLSLSTEDGATAKLEEEQVQQGPQPNVGEFQSAKNIEMEEKLVAEFIDERTALEKDEMDSKFAFEKMVAELTAQAAQTQRDRDAKAEAKAAKLQGKANAEGDLQDTSTSRDADMKYAKDLKAECKQKASDFESRQQLRAEEIEAIEKAIEIISSGAVAGSAKKHLPKLVQTSFAQLRSAAVTVTPVQERVAQYLKEKAASLNSRVLSVLAVRASADPFVKVKKMIKDLIVQMTEQAHAEAEQKGWCDQELGHNAATRKEKTENVELLHAEIDELEATIAKLTEDIVELSEAVAELDDAMAKATELRGEEKTKNIATIEDADAAQTAVASAVTVLREFYAKAEKATVFVQGKDNKKPEIFDEPYKGMQSENGGVLGMLEVIESDFARLKSDTKASEATAQAEYDDFMSDSKIDKTGKETDIEHKTTKKQDHSETLTIRKSDLEGAQKELDAALAYYDKLKPSCVDSGVSYEDRVARRKEEIESLQEAAKILAGDDIA